MVLMGWEVKEGGVLIGTQQLQGVILGSGFIGGAGGSVGLYIEKGAQYTTVSDQNGIF